MATISIEGKTVAAGGGHLYLVYRDNSGREFVIRGGPENNNPLAFGEVALEIGVPMANSEDFRAYNNASLGARGHKVLNLDGRSAEAVWEIMLETAASIQSKTTSYNALGTNSNSVIAAVLKASGLTDIQFPNTPGVTGPFSERWQGYSKGFGSLPNTSSLDFTSANSLFDALTLTYENALGSFFPSGKVPKFEPEGTYTANWSQQKKADFVSLISKLNEVKNEINEYKAENSAKLTAAQKSELTAQSKAVGDFVSNAQWVYVDPLVIDLDFDGIETIASDNHIAFDLANVAGASVTQGWIGSDDGFIAIDKNRDGVINNINELFGNENISGVDALRELDCDANSYIDENDDMYSQIVIWKDINSDGISQGNEVDSLQEYGITQISLNETSVDIDSNGNKITSVISAITSGGGSMIIGDVQFIADYSSAKANGTADVFIFNDDEGQQTIHFFEDGLDLIKIRNHQYDDLVFSETPDGVNIIVDGESNIFIADIKSSQLSQEDFVFT